MTDSTALKTEFYQRLADAKQCPCCASDFVEWVIDEGVSIENTRGESTRQLRRDANRVLGIAYTWDALYAANDPDGMYLCSDLRREFP